MHPNDQLAATYKYAPLPAHAMSKAPQLGGASPGLIKVAHPALQTVYSLIWQPQRASQGCHQPFRQILALAGMSHHILAPQRRHKSTAYITRYVALPSLSPYCVLW